MSSLPLSLLPPSAISPSAFHQALKLYPSLVEKVYRSKLKNDPKKVADALERDLWRFEVLPAAVAAATAADAASSTGVGRAQVTTQASKKDESKKKRSLPDALDGSSVGGGLTKDAVERLVQWKM
ncbi:uncharacterized protein A1O5_05465 [Cladophialophora psammophila CBS 110553]|uniref:Uncharacterized protein n=1 Tax=Cladophialophora psammophila CBS 110553 TaxID=1182543 RepID=W9WTW6_9EURO|nr:uncharacterized protein A1O5_05465 [Cladophialophora psammophila CBS 110553]EXJ71657.1 hypothetical protein A1O5_05465 [Cladophialophora psammophila CBS 110553]